MKLFALDASKIFGEQVADNLGLPLSPHEEREFEDGEHKARPPVLRTEAISTQDQRLRMTQAKETSLRRRMIEDMEVRTLMLHHAVDALTQGVPEQD